MQISRRVKFSLHHTANVTTIIVTYIFQSTEVKLRVLSQVTYIWIGMPMFDTGRYHFYA